MTEDDKYALKEFLRAVGVTAGVFVVFCIIFLVIINLSTGGEPLSPSFEVVDKYKDDWGIFVSFTQNLQDRNKYSAGEKIGINPKSPFATPIGIYTYPLAASYEIYFKYNHIPFQGQSPMMWFLRPKNPKRIAYGSKYTEHDLTNDLERLKKIIASSDQFNDHIKSDIESYMKKVDNEIEDLFKSTPIQTLWSTTREMAFDIRIGDSRVKPNVRWTGLLFKLYDGVVDDLGQGFIHKNEEYQAVFFNKSVLNVVELIQKKPNEWIIYRRFTVPLISDLDHKV